MLPETIELLQALLWLLAGLIAFYFSIDSARIWTSISLGFFLVFVSQAYVLAPWVQHPILQAIHVIVGTIAIMVITHGFQEDYVFSRTLAVSGGKAIVYGLTAAVIVASLVFLLINPVPDESVLRNIRMIENTCWVFLSLINIDMIRKIYTQVQDSPVGRPFMAFIFVFGLIFLWKGSELYVQVYGWDLASAAAEHMASVAGRVRFSMAVHEIASFLASLSVGGTFVYLWRTLR